MLIDDGKNIPYLNECPASIHNPLKVGSLNFCSAHTHTLDLARLDWQSLRHELTP